MLRLAHISDVHLGPLPDITLRELASKRVVGYVNWQRNRKKFLHDGVTDAILADIRAVGVDHTAITGDLVNLALDAELEGAREWLEELGDPRTVSVVPGNHDAYVPGAFAKCCKLWQPWMSGDGQTGSVTSESFPYLRVRGNVALIGITSARASAPFMATGYFRREQARRLTHLLDETGARGLFRLLMIHHPPVRAAVPQHKRLFGISSFQRIVRGHGAELVIHGHSHLPSLFHIEGGRGKPVPVVGVAATGQAPGGKKPGAQWNLLEIEGSTGDWSIGLTRRGLKDASTGVQEIQRMNLGAIRPAVVETPEVRAL